MFLTSKEFFSRSNRKLMYSTYLEHCRAFITTCEVFIDKCYILDTLLDKYKDTAHVYSYLKSIKKEVTSLGEYDTACKYRGGATSNVILNYGSYRDLMTAQGRIQRATGSISAAILLCDTLEKEELTLRSK